MEKKSVSAVSIVFYILGILFLAASAFMLVLAVTYTKTYVESYDATFADMWTNCIQYIISEFAPYFGIGIMCLGIGLANRNRTYVRTDATGDEEKLKNAVREVIAEKDSREHPDYSDMLEKIEGRISHLEKDVDATREVLSIKIEEKEKRDTYRIRELGSDIKGALAAADSRPKKATRTEAKAEVKTEAKAEKETVKPIPLFTMAKTMAMPDVPKPKKKRTRKKSGTKKGNKKKPTENKE